MARDLLEIALGYDPDTPPPSFPAEAVASDLTTRLAPLATGLYRLGALAPPLRRLSDALKKDVKAVPKRVLQAQLPKHGAAGAGAGAGVDAAPEDKAKGLLAQLKELDLDAYEDVMGQVRATALSTPPLFPSLLSPIAPFSPRPFLCLKCWRPTA
jgi:hypothetical protein